MESRLSGLDFMRALACMLVLFTHLMQKLDFTVLKGAWQTTYLVLFMGSCGVSIFFMLSGFLLSHPFWRAFDAKRPTPDLGHYALRRAARIVPGYYVALIVSFILSVTVFSFPLTNELWWRLASGLLFVSEFYPITFFPVEVNQPLWSIGMEVFSYALLPIAFAIVFAGRRALGHWRGRIVFAAIVGVAILGHWLIRNYVPVMEEGRGWDHGAVGGAKQWMPLFNPVGFFVYFAMGGLAAGLSTLWQRGRTPLADLLAIAGLVIAFWQLVPFSGERRWDDYGWIDLPYFFPQFQIGICLALLSLPHSRVLGSILDNQPVRFIARISFGIYIWHMLAIELVREFVNPRYAFGGIKVVDSWIVLSEIVVILALIAAMLSWRFIEKPALEWGRKRSAAHSESTPQSPADAAVAGR